MKTEKVILVDTLDNPVGEIEKIEAHSNALLHRAVSVFIFSPNGGMLLQQRSFSKYHSPGLWTNTACTHPYPNETNEKAAHRRLEEEMGIKTELKEIFHFIYNEKLDNDLTEHELDHVFIGITGQIPRPDPREVNDFRYMAMGEIVASVKACPQEYTVWFRKIVDRVISYYKDHLTE